MNKGPAQEESKIMSNKKHFWQVHPEIDYEACLRERNLYFNPSKGEKLETLEGGPVPRMS